MVADDWESFTAEIRRPTEMQTVGTFTWRGGGPKTPKMIKERGRRQV